MLAGESSYKSTDGILSPSYHTIKKGNKGNEISILQRRKEIQGHQKKKIVLEKPEYLMRFFFVIQIFSNSTCLTKQIMYFADC